MKAIDSHVHCGLVGSSGIGEPDQSFEAYYGLVKGCGIDGAVFFPPVIEVYNRYDPYFTDSSEWQGRRNAAHDYLLSLTGNLDFKVFPYLFVWNDYAYERLSEGFYGVKWHRHSGEPRYNYDDPRCLRFIQEVRLRRMPVVLEEEFHNTVRFVKDLAPGVTVIIPHCGMLNGGYERIKAEGLWELENVYADTALAPSWIIEDFISRYGPEKLLFGSDFPFGDPVGELRKVTGLKVDDGVKLMICRENILRILERVRKEGS
ncbi:amidohydrolase family protein [Thermodesulforhabdus norvegica]|uniref:Amidohydrolase n=1 Tax=Thermodesulforhabdus norvegica TaxID=39841 RepID=A0A1I4SCV8_9BACT|nr:amidohydrolase family protein [Thermodesulforhabdus norvegica]SFM62346.1 Amidohydrolase [Thermodesulforhabdus norvegica]